MAFINTKKSSTNKEYEPPTKKLISEGDILIKDLVLKQQNTSVNLQDYLEKEQNFEKLSEHIPLTSCCSGTLSLENFQEAQRRLESIQDLRACDLTNEDVQLLLDYRNGKQSEHKNIEPRILRLKIDSILKAIREFKEKEDGKFNSGDQSNFTRKEKEVLAIKPGSAETKLLKFAMENRCDRSEVLPHPMDNIKCIVSNLFCHISEERLDPIKIQKQIRRQANKINSTVIKEGGIPGGSKTIQHPFVNNSKWDVKDPEPPPGNKASVMKTYACKPQNYYTIKDGKIVRLPQNKLPKTVHIRLTERLSIEGIKNLPKFKNYEIGSPSRLLYLKHLPKYITESHLDELFASFATTNKLLYRIMKGKMKGQAFVTFPDVNIAIDALNTVNGAMINGKPVVIEFGKTR